MMKQIWRTPEELIGIGFTRSGVVMMNECHNGLKRSIRSRQIGQRILATAHDAGGRYLAMEALSPSFAAAANQQRRPPPIESRHSPYLGQPEMRSLIQAALDLGWTLLPYEADMGQWLQEQFPTEFADCRTEQQLRHLLESLPPRLRSLAFTNWREEQQARNIIQQLQALPPDAKMLVWCGNRHHTKAVVNDWLPIK